MLHLVYDGTTEGIFTCVYSVFKNRRMPDFVDSIHLSSKNFLDDYQIIETDPKKSDYIYRMVGRKISITAQAMIAVMALSQEKDAGLKIIKYIAYGLKVGKKIDHAYGNSIVLDAWNIRNNVMMEYHRYLGFLRFNKLDGDIYYAAYAPKNRINMLLAEHFSDRMKNEKWIIHDEPRKSAVVYNGKIYLEIPFSKEEYSETSFSEDTFDGLWKEFLTSLTIKERANYKLQLSNLPKRYRGYMNEMN